MIELTDLVGELVVLAHDEPDAPPEPVRWDQFVRTAVQRVAHPAGHRQLHLELQPWQAIGDPTALERAVVNVLDNAVKFSPPASIIDIRLQDSTLQVTDQGPGTSPKQRSHVFERFWRSDMLALCRGPTHAARSRRGEGRVHVAGHTSPNSRCTWRPCSGRPTTTLAEAMLVADRLATVLGQTIAEGVLYLGYPVLVTADDRVDIDALLVTRVHGLVALCS